jgi:AbrB family looped-hinge helix DNA binding protein
MGNAITVKGQVTIPKRFREAMRLQPGDEVDFIFDEKGEVILRRAGESRPAIPPTAPDGPDRFDRARGSAHFKFGSTAEYMKFIRGDDYEINGEP